MKRAIVTGGGGSIAQAIAKVLSRYYDVLAPNKEELNVTEYGSVSGYMYYHSPHLLVNCAGYIQPASIEKSNPEYVLKDMMVNYYGPYLCSKLAIQNGRCETIINVGSTSGFEGRANWGAYCSSKAALVAFTETLAKEGINAYGVHPARTKSKMRERLFPGEDQNTLMEPERVGRIIEAIVSTSRFTSGTQIIVTKDKIIELPMRICPK